MQIDGSVRKVLFRIVSHIGHAAASRRALDRDIGSPRRGGIDEPMG
jgi:hypothetical protein